MINVFEPTVGVDELAAVDGVFASRWLGKGKVTDQFEAAFAEHVGVKREQLTSVSCATEGLFQICEMLDVWRVVLPAISFVGAGNAIREVGGSLVLCDVDPRTLNPTAEHIDAVMDRKIDAVMLMHYGGVPCEMDDILPVLPYRTWLIEDSACSMASRYKGQSCGTFGQFGVWSFDSMKVAVAGDGGMVWSSDMDTIARIRERVYLGMDSTSGLASDNERWWEFKAETPGRRAIMNDIEAAIGLTQLRKLPQLIARRREVWDSYNEQLADVPWLLLPPPPPPHVESSYYFYWIQTERRDELARYLRAKDIYTTFRYWPLHWAYGIDADLPGAEQAARTTLLLPLHANLTDGQVEYICEMVREFGGGGRG